MCLERHVIKGCIVEFRDDDLWGKLFLGSAIVDGTFEYFEIERIVKDKGRPPHDLKNMVKFNYILFIF